MKPLRSTKLYLEYYGMVHFNQLFLLLKRLPILRKKLPSAPKTGATGKKVYTVLGLYYKVFSSLVRSALLMAIYYFPWKVIPCVSMAHGFFQSFFFLSILAGPFFLSRGRPEMDWNGYYFLRLFRFPCKLFFLNRVFLNLAKTSIALFFPLFFMGRLTDHLWVSLMAFCASILMRILSAAFDFWVHEKEKHRLYDNANLKVVLFCIILVLAYVPIFEEKSFLLIYCALGISILGAVWGLFYLKRADYEKLSKGLSTTDELKSVKNVMVDSNFADVRVEERDEDLLHIQVPSDKKGYAYLHEIMFQRLNKQLTERSMKITKYMALGIPLLLVGGYLVKTKSFDLGDEEKIESLYITILRISFFYSYLLSQGERFTKILFLYMDRDLLPYPYYREPSAIRTCLRIRLGKLLQITAPLTLVMTLLFYAFFGFFYDILGWKLLYVIPVMVIQSAFYALYRLMVYYILQPYTLKKEKKSMGANIADIVVYLVALSFLQIKDLGAMSILVLCIFMGILSCLAPYLLRTFGPKNFKIRTI